MELITGFYKKKETEKMFKHFYVYAATDKNIQNNII